MAKKKVVHRSSEDGEFVSEEFAEKNPATTQKETMKMSCVNPLMQEFGNGDMNILRDKINEIIAKL